jgi:4-hydroxybenzoate polyprenyltransferase
VTTALADVLAGCAVAGGPPDRPVAWLLASTACLYAGGVVLNDVFDRQLDARERPERPIPSGRVPAAGAGALGAALLAAGIAAASRATGTAAVIAALIAALVLLYDAGTKPHAVLGPITMGSCRGLNLLLGIAAVPAAVTRQWPMALLPFVYIAAVTGVSRGEVHGGRSGAGRLALAAVTAVIAALVVLQARSSTTLWALALSALLAWRVLPPFIQAADRPDPATIRRAVRAGVLSLVFLDAAIAGAFGGVLYALACLALAPAAYGLSRLFAVT